MSGQPDPGRRPTVDAVRERRRRWRDRRERGALGAMVAVLAPAVIALAGLVYDGGLALEGRQRANDVAEQAARAAANQCDQEALRTASKCLVTDQAAAAGAAGQFAVNGVAVTNVRLLDGGTVVEVQGDTDVQTVFLGLFGINNFHIAVRRQATAITGLAGN